MWGVCVDDQWVRRPSGSQRDAAACTSRGQGARRWLSSVARTTTSQAGEEVVARAALGDGELADELVPAMGT